MKKRPHLFRNNINKEINNNMKVYYTNSYSENENTIDEKLNKLLEKNGYIFNLDVIIKTNDSTYDTRLAGKIKNYLITLDNKIIPIKDIIEITEKK